ncbi:MAG TPA: hypothetical protein VKV20_10910 [Ktedonobacteraceae bacterium]|jgi:hypothetical protein|nr:hypothetical protein [Ktedonobacteraceae bacterium]
MIYYRVALRANETAHWQWKSTLLTSLESIMGLIKMLSSVPQERIRVFFSTSPEKLNEMLARENEGLTSNSMTAIQFLSGQRISREDIVGLESEPYTHEKKDAIPASIAAAKAVNEHHINMNSAGISVLDIRRLEVEPGTPGDHDTHYRFSLPVSMPQTLAWLRLMLKVQSGELVP